MSNAVTSSAALTELKTDLTKLSTTLHEIFDLMNTDMSQVGEAWQDGKYQEFVNGYKPQIQKCEEISIRYSEWCSRVLDPTIENVIAVEKTDVGNGDGSAGGASVASTGSMAGASLTGADAVGSTIGSKFNVGLQPNPAQGKIHYNHYSQAEKMMGMPRDAEMKCIDTYGRNWSPVSDKVANKYSSSFEVRDTPSEKEIHGEKFGGTMEGKVGTSIPFEKVTATAEVGGSGTIGYEKKTEKNWDPIHCMNQDDIDKINKMNGFADEKK